MLKIKRYLFIILALSLMISCKPGTRKTGTEDPSSEKDLFPDKLKVEYSTSFSIEYHNTYKVLNVFTGWKGRDSVFKYVLYQRGTKPPADYKDAQKIKIPIRTIVCLSSIYVGYLEALHLTDALVGVDDFRYINSPNAVKKIKAGKISEVGSNNNLVVEKVLGLSPDLVFTYGMGNQYDAHPKLMEANIKVAITTDHAENTPLARAEWIKVMAVFFNKEKEADTFFNGIARRYKELARICQNVKQRPTAFTAIKYGDLWYVPGGNSYLAAQLRDAGADYLWKDNDQRGSIHLSFEQVFDKASEADYWLNVDEWRDKGDVLKNDPRNREFKAFKQDNIYNNNARLNQNGGNDFWETGLLNSDIVLADLISIFHPELLPSHKMVYYKKLPLSKNDSGI